MIDTTLNLPEQTDRIANLERQIRDLTAERDSLRKRNRELINELMPFEPLTSDEARSLLNGPQGPPLKDLLDRLEREAETKA